MPTPSTPTKKTQSRPSNEETGANAVRDKFELLMKQKSQYKSPRAAKTTREMKDIAKQCESNTGITKEQFESPKKPRATSPKPTMKTPSKEDKRRALARAKEWAMKTKATCPKPSPTRQKLPVVKGTVKSTFVQPSQIISLDSDSGEEESKAQIIVIDDDDSEDVQDKAKAQVKKVGATEDKAADDFKNADAPDEDIFYDARSSLSPLSVLAKVRVGMEPVGISFSTITPKRDP